MASQLCCSGLVNPLVRVPFARHIRLSGILLVPGAEQAFGASRELTRICLPRGTPCPDIPPEDSYSCCKTQPRMRLVQEALPEHSPHHTLLPVPGSSSGPGR